MEKLKVLFLGTGNGLVNDTGIYHSNLVVIYGEDRLFIDCGSDFPHALRDASMSHRNIKNTYISHIHADHAGSLEWLGFISRFDPEVSAHINLFAFPEVIMNLETILKPSMQNSIEGFKDYGLTTCFTLFECFDNFDIGKMHCTIIPTLHVNVEDELYSYGLYITAGDQSLLFTSDTQFNPDVFEDYYKTADLILHDCSTGPVAYPAHAHISQLQTLPNQIREKMILYHYGPGEKPDAKALGFKDYAKQGKYSAFSNAKSPFGLFIFPIASASRYT